MTRPQAFKTGRTVLQVCRERAVFSEDVLIRILDPWRMTEADGKRLSCGCASTLCGSSRLRDDLASALAQFSRVHSGPVLALMLGSDHEQPDGAVPGQCRWAPAAGSTRVRKSERNQPDRGRFDG